jgi:hypothetical protein
MQALVHNLQRSVRCKLRELSYASSNRSYTLRFCLVWLTVMMLFPLSLLLLKFNRGRLPRTPNTPLRVIFSAFAVAIAVFAGNIAVNPKTAAYVLFFPSFVPHQASTATSQRTSSLFSFFSLGRNINPIFSTTYTGHMIRFPSCIGGR